jgi:hypothetical protein
MSLRHVPPLLVYLQPVPSSCSQESLRSCEDACSTCSCRPSSSLLCIPMTSVCFPPKRDHQVALLLQRKTVFFFFFPLHLASGPSFLLFLFFFFIWPRAHSSFFFFFFFPVCQASSQRALFFAFFFFSFVRLPSNNQHRPSRPPVDARESV